jgi:hypothetical protein
MSMNTKWLLDSVKWLLDSTIFQLDCCWILLDGLLYSTRVPIGYAWWLLDSKSWLWADIITKTPYKTVKIFRKNLKTRITKNPKKHFKKRYKSTKSSQKSVKNIKNLRNIRKKKPANPKKLKNHCENEINLLLYEPINETE